jgi:hypothetical protein
MYICGRDGMGAKGGVKGGPTMTGPDAAARVCFCGVARDAGSKIIIPLVQCGTPRLSKDG